MKKMLLNAKYWLIMMSCTCGLSAQATSHFSFTSNTGNNMILLIKSSIQPSINGEALESGDEIGVFNEDSLCVGATVWSEENTVITIWGDNDQTDETDGMRPGETLVVRIWDASDSKEYTASLTMENSDHSMYAADINGIAQTIEVTIVKNRKVHRKVVNYGISEGVLSVYDIKGRAVVRGGKLSETYRENRSCSNGAFIYSKHRDGRYTTYLRTTIR